MKRRDLSPRERGALTTARRRLSRAEDRLQAERAQLDALVLECVEADVKVVDIADTLDLSREAIYKSVFRARHRKVGPDDDRQAKDAETPVPARATAMETYATFIRSARP